METTVRPLAAAGVALLGAGVIAASPIAPTLPDLHMPAISSPAVALSALPSWLNFLNTGTVALVGQVAEVSNLLQNEIADPVPALTTILHNQIANAQVLGSALVTSGQVVATTLVSLPAGLANAVSAAIADPTQIPAILTTLANGLLLAASSAIAPVIDGFTDVITTTVTRAVGVTSAVVANLAPIALSVLDAPIAIGTQLFNSALAIASAVGTLNPLNVIGALGQAGVDLEVATYNAVKGVVNAIGDLRGDVVNALSTPLPSAPPPVILAAAAATDSGPTLKLAAASELTAARVVVDPLAPLKRSLARTQRMAGAVATDTLATVRATLDSQTQVGKTAVGGAQEVVKAATTGGDVAGTAKAARSATKESTESARGTARKRTAESGANLRRAAQGAESQK